MSHVPSCLVIRPLSHSHSNRFHVRFCGRPDGRARPGDRGVACCLQPPRRCGSDLRRHWARHRRGACASGNLKQYTRSYKRSLAALVQCSCGCSYCFKQHSRSERIVSSPTIVSSALCSKSLPDDRAGAPPLAGAAGSAAAAWCIWKHALDSSHSNHVLLACPQDDRAGAPLLLAPSGARLALRHEMRRPFAAWLARQAASAAQGPHRILNLHRIRTFFRKFPIWWWVLLKSALQPCCNRFASWLIHLHAGPGGSPAARPAVWKGRVVRHFQHESVRCI